MVDNFFLGVPSFQAPAKNPITHPKKYEWQIFCDKKLRTYQEQQFFFKTYYLWRWMCTLIRNDILILCYQWYISTINYLHNNKFNDSCFASIFPIPAFKDWFLQICFFYALFINISNFNVHVLGSLMGN